MSVDKSQHCSKYILYEHDVIYEHCVMMYDDM
jgi:hypothetical protein